MSTSNTGLGGKELLAYVTNMEKSLALLKSYASLLARVNENALKIEQSDFNDAKKALSDLLLELSTERFPKLAQLVNKVVNPASNLGVNSANLSNGNIAVSMNFANVGNSNMLNQVLSSFNNPETMNNLMNQVQNAIQGNGQLNIAELTSQIMGGSNLNLQSSTQPAVPSEDSYLGLNSTNLKSLFQGNYKELTKALPFLGLPIDSICLKRLDCRDDLTHRI